MLAKMESTFFSIVIPSYNRADFIEKTIKSVLAQTFTEFEVIVVDDGSTDDTKKVILSIESSKIRYVYTSNRERAAARNTGAKSAIGEYIYFLDSDDLLYPKHLELARQFILKNQTKVFFQQYEFTLENGKKRQAYKPSSKILNKELIKRGNFMSCHGVFIDRKVFLQNLFNEDRELSGSEDYELWLRLAARYPIFYSPAVSSTLVFHSMRSVLNMNKEELIKRKELMLEYILKDSVFISKYEKYVSQLKADAYSYIALHSILAGEKRVGINYYLKALLNKPSFFFSKRAIIILKRFFGI